MHRKRRVSALAAAIRALLAAGGMVGAHVAWANCTTVGLATTCDANDPNPWTTRIGTGPTQASGSSILVGVNAGITLGNSTAISFADNATVTVSAGATVQNAATVGSGLYGSNHDTVQVRHNGVVTVEAGGRILSTGTAPSAEAINPQGSGNTILNRGEIRAANAAAMWFEQGNDTIDNYGTIEGYGGTGNAFGGYGGALLFHNRETGVVRGNLVFGNGNDTLFLYTGSVLTGALHGGGGTDAITLRGTGAAAIPGALDGFDSVTKEDAGTWELTGTIAGNMSVLVDAGTLRVSGNNAGFTGTMTVGSGATLEGNAQSLTPTITNNGVVHFVQASAGTYGGVIEGSGSVRKTGDGALTLGGTNTYTGGTVLNAGIVQVGSNAHLGDASGALTFNGGTLRTSAGFTLARTTTLQAGGGTFEPMAGSTLVHTGPVSGSGALTKAGAGTLVLAGNATYTGGTTIAAGTLQLGNGGTTGAVPGNVVDNGVLAFNRSDTLVFGGIVSGTGQLHQIGSGTTVLTGANTYAGGTLIGAGTLRVGNGGTSGSLVGDVANSGALVFDRSDGFTYASRISGTGTVTIANTGTMVFTADHAYTGTTSVLGTLQLGDGGTAGNVAGAVALSGTLVFDRSDTFDFGGPITGSGSLVQAGSGTTVLTGNNTFTGSTSVAAGGLEVDGSIGGSVDVASGARLGGVGTIAGAVDVAAGGHIGAGGEGSAGTLRIGSLVLDAGALLDYDLGTPDVVGGGVNDLIVVDNDLTLDGMLHVTDLGGFGARSLTATGVAPGVYRLLDYGGALTDNGLDLGTLPPGFDAAAFLVQTSVAGEVNLVLLDEDFTLQFWDGANETADGVIHGGDGTWDNAATRWTNVDGVVNTNWRSGFAVFQGEAGTVSLVEDVSIGGMQFATDGYRIDGGDFALQIDAPVTLVRVNDGTATIDATIADGAGGPANLTKTDNGLLVLTGTNTYSGGTTFLGGAVQVERDANLGASTGTLTFDGGALIAAGTLDSARATTLLDGGGILATMDGTTLTLEGTIDGTGALRKTGSGTLVLRGTNTYAGGTQLDAGVLEIDSDANLGDAAGTLGVDGGTLHAVGSSFQMQREIVLDDGGGTFDVDAALVLTTLGPIDGSGLLTKTGAGTLVLANTANTWSGGTAILEGTVEVASDNALGAATGALYFDGGTLRASASFDSARAVTLDAGGGAFDIDAGVVLALDGTLAGPGALAKQGAGTLVLTRDNTYTAGTTIAEGTLQLGDGTGSGGSVLGDILDNGALVFDHLDDVTVANAIHGTGTVTKRGENTLTLTGESTYTGLTSIEAGLLRIGDGGNRGAIVGDVDNAGELAFDRADAWAFAGTISGSGSVRQSGSGVLTLSGNNTYRGGTFLDAGVLRIAADANLGDPTGTVVFDGGTLRFDAAFDTARDIRVDAGGATFDVTARNTVTGALGGVGDVTKIGDGTLVVNHHADFSGLTRVLQGTLVVGDSAHATTQWSSGSAGAVEVARGARFGGCGSLRGTIRNDGTVGVCNALEALHGEAGLQFTVAGTVSNAGTLLLSNGVIGNQLTVDTYTANGGVLVMDAVLDAGGDAAQSDRLFAGVVQLGSAPTGIRVHNLGGEGAVTTGLGIPLIEGADPAQSDADAFVLEDRVVAGIFEYHLAYSGGSWFLQSDDPEAPGQPLLRPEIGAYLGNRRAATSLLVHTWHDRPFDAHHGDAWLRLVGGNVRVDAAEGHVEARGGRSMLQAGADVAHVALGANGRVHLGAMLGATRSDVDVDVVHNPAHARGTTDGVVGGVYATWLADEQRRLGAYVDTWLQHGRFDNAVAGESLAQETYDADVWAASAEFGYAWGAGRVVLEPQVQVVVTDYASDEVVEHNGTHVTALDARETLWRAGVRVRGREDDASPVRPFLEANWWNGDGLEPIAFNDQPIRGGVPADRYELKTGLAARLGERLALVLQMEGEWGAHGYRTFQGQVALHARW